LLSYLCPTYQTLLLVTRDCLDIIRILADYGIQNSKNAIACFQNVNEISYFSGETQRNYLQILLTARNKVLGTPSKFPSKTKGTRKQHKWVYDNVRKYLAQKKNKLNVRVVLFAVW